MIPLSAPEALELLRASAEPDSKRRPDRRVVNAWHYVNRVRYQQWQSLREAESVIGHATSIYFVDSKVFRLACELPGDQTYRYQVRVQVVH